MSPDAPLPLIALADMTNASVRILMSAVRNLAPSRALARDGPMINARH
jgi:hypothetical protein